MNIVVIGLGSMGKRRLRLLKQYIVNEQLNPKEWILIGVDSNVERCQEVKSEYQVETYLTLNEALQKESIDCAVISTSPHTHDFIIEECLKQNLSVFTEINLLKDGYEKNIELAKKNNKILFLSSTFMYRKEIEYIKEEVSKKNFSGIYQYHIGQYLPEWHPWENYQNFFVGRKDTNGCREIFAIELPWLVNVFGDVVEIKSIHKKTSQLEIDYDDSYIIQLQHSSGVLGSLIVDIITPKAGRNLEIWSEKFYIGWNGTPDTLVQYDKDSGKIKAVELYNQIDHQEGYSQFVVENAYYDEIVNFIHCVQGKEEARHSFEKDMVILSYIDEIEK